MHFTMTAPCDNCPFRRRGFVPLRADRVREIAGGLLQGNGMFACHKTVEWGTDDDGDDYEMDREKQEHCAGALIFCEKQNRPTQMMRIAERIGHAYDARKLREKDAVFASLPQMLAAHRRKVK